MCLPAMFVSIHHYKKSQCEIPSGVSLIETKVDNERKDAFLKENKDKINLSRCNKQPNSGTVMNTAMMNL